MKRYLVGAVGRDGRVEHIFSAPSTEVAKQKFTRLTRGSRKMPWRDWTFQEI